MKKYLLVLSLFTACFTACFTSCARAPQEDTPHLSVINLIDNNGMTETLSTPDRLKQYEATDFLSCQPYKKVMRIYRRDATGNVKAYVTSYHPNGQPRQYLEIENGRAFGKYQEWFASGQIKINASVIGGEADISVSAERTWLFDGLNEVWDENGNLVASLPYSKGYLDGISTYYHPQGKVWKIVPYAQNKREGTQYTYLETGELFSQTTYHNDELDGPLQRFWSPDNYASDEWFCSGQLVSGVYWDSKGEEITRITDGNGKRTLFNKLGVSEIQEYRNGRLEGRVEKYNRAGRLAATYYVKNGLKSGEEVQFYPQSLEPKLLISWYEGKIQGTVKTWYPNGQLENQREMSDNKKNGLLTAWYNDGSLMMIEEYDHDTLTRGEYYRKGERRPVTEVVAGKGTATLFNQEGLFLKRIPYANGNPEI